MSILSLENRIKVRSVPGVTGLPGLYFRIGGVAAKTTLNGILIPDLTTSGLQWTGMNKSMHDSILLGMAGDHDQVIQSHVFEAQILACFRQNSRDIEKQANIINDIALPGKLGHEVIGPRTPIYIPDIYLELTPNIGELYYRVKANQLAYDYIMECTQLTNDRIIVSVTGQTVQNAMGNMQGFVSGALYIVRAQPVFAKGVRGEYTGYYEIRMG